MERLSVFGWGDEQVRTAPIDELPGGVAPNDIMLYSADQLSQYGFSRESESAKSGGEKGKVRVMRQYPPRPYESQCPLDWVAADGDLGSGGSAFLPAGTVFRKWRDPYTVASSSGTAAAKDRTTAALRSLLELIERDAIAIWWYNSVPRPPVRVDNQPAEIEIAHRLLRARARRMWTLDLTTDLPIPVVATLSDDGSGKDLLFGFGVGKNKSAALRHAAGELMQALALSERAESPALASVEECGQHMYPDTSAPDREAARRSVDFLTAGETNVVAMDRMLDSLSEAGIEAHCVDVTREESPVHVVRTVAPGLRPMQRRLGPGRLYDVPVSEEWISQSRREEEMREAPPFLG